MAENIHYTAPMSLTERVDALTQIAMSLTKGRDEMVSRLAGIRQLAQDHAEKVIDAAARNIEANTGKSIEELCKVAAMDLEDRFNLLTSKQQVALTSRADAIEKRILAERQRAVTLADVRPELESLVAGAIESRRVELSKGADNAAQEAVKVALASMDVPFSKMVFKGQWDPSATYSVNDVVYYRGGSFVALQSTQQLPAAVSPDWQQIAAAGARGPAGNDGDAAEAIAAKEAAEAAAAQTEADRIAVEAAAAIVIPATDLNAARNAAAPRQGYRIGPSLSDRVTFEPHKLGGGAMTLIWSSANLPTDSTRALIHYQTRTGTTDFSDGINIFQPGGAPAKLDVVLRQQESANAYYRIQSVDNIFDGKWKRLAVVIDNSGADPDIKLYVNGVLAGVSVTTAKTGTFDDSAVNNAVISLAGSGTAHHTQGDIILYNFALTGTQIADRYASGVWVPAEEQWGQEFNLTTFANGTPAWSTLTGASATGVTLENAGAGGQGGWELPRLIENGEILTVTGNMTIDSGTPSPAVVLRRNITSSTTDSNVVILSAGGDFSITLTANSNLGQFLAISDGDIGGVTFSNVRLFKKGSTLNLQPQGLGRQLLDVSANRNHALATSHPAYTQPANRCVHKITVANATGSVTNTNLAGGAIQPANTYIESIRFIRTDGTGAFQIGTASGGAQVVASTSAASGVATMVILRDTTTDANVFVNMAANTTYDFIFTFAKI